MHSIKIGVSKSKFLWYNPLRWVSAFVRLFTGKYNHAFFIIDNTFIVEANSKGVELNYMGANWREDSSIRVYDLNFEYSHNQMRTFLFEQIGKGYDFKGTIIDQLTFSIKKLFYKVFDGKAPRWTGHSKDFATKKFYCSELVGYVINKFNPELFPSWEQYHPTDIYKLSESTDLLTVYYDGKTKEYN